VSEDFGVKLSRWSQRKQAARRGVAVEDAADEAGHGEEPAAQEAPKANEIADARRDTAVADAASSPDEETPVLPPVDELTADSDYTVFMSEKVPEAIRRAALRKLWFSDPVFANLDRLNDYDDDYSIVETVASAVRTSYQVGKGHVDAIEEKLAKLEAANSDQAGVTERAESPDSSPGAESRARSGASDDGTLGDNDAAGDESGTAPRQVSETVPGEGPDGSAEDNG
jgi:hypothetical protein